MIRKVTRVDDAAQIRGVLEDWTDALRAKDIDAIMAVHAPDILGFDCHSQLRLKGAAAYRKHLEACLPCMRGPMLFEIHDLDITAQGELAFCHYLARCGATGTDGQQDVCWLRMTACLCKVREKWMIVHDHCSVPFEPESGMALLDLHPERTGRATAA
jgi:ketosteroid isomerase-like protein